MNRTWGLAAFLLAAVPVHWVMAQEDETATSSSYEQRKQEAELRGIDLGNEKAAQELKAGKAKAILDALPTSPTSGAISVKEGAGQAEANALAAGAAFELADLIAARLKGAADKADQKPAGPTDDSGSCDLLEPSVEGANDAPQYPAAAPATSSVAGAKPRGVVPLLLISGSENLSFGRWDQFRFRACKIASDYETAIKDGKIASIRLRTINRRPGGAAVGVATAISAAVKLAQLGMPDWEIASLQTSVTNRPVLLEVADAYRTIEPDAANRPLYWQGAVSKLGASARIFKALDSLSATSGSADDTSNELGKEIEVGEKLLAAKKPKPKPELEPAVKVAKESKAKLDAVIASHAALLKDLYGGDPASPLPIAGLVSEAAAASLLGSRGLVASINVDSTGGTSASRKVLWNIFDPSSPPLFISGTVSISYAAVRPADQQLLVSGAYSCSTGPVRLRRVAAVVNPGGTLSCEGGK